MTHWRRRRRRRRDDLPRHQHELSHSNERLFVCIKEEVIGIYRLR